MSETKTSAYIGVSGADLRLLRIMLGLSAHEVADISGYYVSSVRSMENCFYRPSDKVIYALADYVSKDVKAHERLQHVKSLLGLMEVLGPTPLHDAGAPLGSKSYALELSRIKNISAEIKESLSAKKETIPALSMLLESFDFEVAKLAMATDNFCKKIKNLEDRFDQLIQKETKHD